MGNQFTQVQVVEVAREIALLQAHQRIIALLARETLLVEGYIYIYGEQTSTEANSDIKPQGVLEGLGTRAVEELLIGGRKVVVDEIGRAVLPFHIAQVAHVKHLHVGPHTV